MKALLQTYPDFLECLDQLGFLPLSHMLPGLPSLSALTPSHLWHTGNPETDPWRWKDRVAEEKQAAYGCILGGQKGFVAARMYPLFYAACHPAQGMPDRWAAGTISQATWKLWQLYEQRSRMDTSQARRAMGVTAKQGGSQVDAALRRLQKEYYISVAGCQKKVSRTGQLYGWAASLFQRVYDWAPPEWLAEAGRMGREEAIERILEAGEALGENLDRDALAQKLGL